MGEPTGAPYTASLNPGFANASPSYQPAALGPYNPNASAGMPPWSYTPPAAGVAGAGSSKDLKGPLAQFAMNMALQQLAPKPAQQMQLPPYMGAPPRAPSPFQSPYPQTLYQPTAFGGRRA